MTAMTTNTTNELAADCGGGGFEPATWMLRLECQVRVERHPSFVDGIGSNGVLEEMWPLVRGLIDRVIVVELEDAEKALRDLALRHHIVAECAGAVDEDLSTLVWSERQSRFGVRVHSALG